VINVDSKFARSYKEYLEDISINFYEYCKYSRHLTDRKKYLNTQIELTSTIFNVSIETIKNDLEIYHGIDILGDE
jgi:hypothetical protein